MVEIKSNEKRVISPAQVAEQMDEEVAAIMVTNPIPWVFSRTSGEIARSSTAREGLSTAMEPISTP